MADIPDNPCEDERRRKAKALIAKFPGVEWVARPMVDSEKSQEFVLFTPQEILWSLPATTELPPDPPPVKTVQLRVVYDISVRAGPGQTYAVLGSVKADTVLVFTDEAAADADYSWRRLADGFEGATAWIAERNIAKDRLLLSPLS